uniref:Uncharacterized protein n=1 Tax=Brassica oleracea var. oleracea TaxID=109376 RepID=A0A0D2ZUH7_BRAOL
MKYSASYSYSSANQIPFWLLFSFGFFPRIKDYRNHVVPSLIFSLLPDGIPCQFSGDTQRIDKNLLWRVQDRCLQVTEEVYGFPARDMSGVKNQKPRLYVKFSAPVVKEDCKVSKEENEEDKQNDYVFLVLQGAHLYRF